MGEIGNTFGGRNGDRYHYCTGYEGQDRVCWWCGLSFESKRSRHCCCPEHTKEYERHFEWGAASRWALKRSGGKCQECGALNKPYSIGWSSRTNLECHHIIPLNGSYRSYSVLNCPCNLQILCLECHGKTRQKKNNVEITNRCRQEVMELGI